MRSGEEASLGLVAFVESAVNDPAFAVEHPQAWIDLFHTRDKALAANGTEQTTGLVVVLGPRGLMGISAGDSQAWLVTSSRVDDLTIGQHTRDRLGSGHAIAAPFQRASLDGVLVMGTDGLFKYAAPDVIARIVRRNPIGPAAESLVELVRLRSGRVAEDVSVVLVRRDDGPEIKP